MEIAENSERGRQERDEVKVKLKTLKAVMEQCQRALEAINADGLHDDHDDDDDNDDDDDDDDDEDYGDDNDDCGSKTLGDERGSCNQSSNRDCEAEELCELIKSRLEGPDFLGRLESAQLSVQQNLSGEEGSSWDMVNENDLWEGGNVENEQEEYVVVRQEDIVDGIACFMAAYLLSLKQTKDLTPNQLQETLSKTFSVKKKKGKLQKALDGTKVIYNVASWSATAIGIYQNPALLRAATTAFWTSCRVISRLF